MPALRRAALVPVVCALLLGGSLPTARSAERALPETVVVHDSRTSDPAVDISEVTLEASWYWDSTQQLRVKVPHGFQAGHRLTVWFDLNADSAPDGHFQLELRKPKQAGGKTLQKSQEFRLGGGWGHSGRRVTCTDSEDSLPVFGPITRGQQGVSIYLDLWSCLQVPNPAGTDSGAWRVAVSLAKGTKEDMAPNHRGWSQPVAGWGPCDPSGGEC
jgi:hypothetical protein